MLSWPFARLHKLRLHALASPSRVQVLSPRRRYAGWLLTSTLLFFILGLAWKLWGSQMNSQELINRCQHQSGRLLAEVRGLQNQILELQIQGQSNRTLLVTEQSSQQALAQQLQTMEKENSELKKNLLLYEQLLSNKKPKLN